MSAPAVLQLADVVDVWTGVDVVAWLTGWHCPDVREFRAFL